MPERPSPVPYIPEAFRNRNRQLYSVGLTEGGSVVLTVIGESGMTLTLTMDTAAAHRLIALLQATTDQSKTFDNR